MYFIPLHRITTLGQDSTSEPWFRRYPWLGFTVAIGGPIVLGVAFLAAWNKLAEER